jgi:hypothetical protein
MSIRRNSLIELGKKELNASVLTNVERVREYVHSYGEYAHYNDKQSLLDLSWCQLFANWLLRKCGYPELPRTYKQWVADKKQNDGFHYIMRAPGNYTPKMGDLYYTVKVNGKVTHHMGFVIEYLGSKRYRTLDGNTGDVEQGITLWGGASNGQLRGGIGGGKVAINTRIDNNVNIEIHSFLELPLMIYTQDPYS